MRRRRRRDRTGPDPDDAAARWRRRSARATSPTWRSPTDDPADVGRSTTTVVEGMGDVTPTVTAGDVERGRRHGHRDARLDLAGRRRGVDLRRPTPQLTRVDDEWQVAWYPRPGRAHPARACARRHPDRRRARRDHRRPPARRWSPTGRSSASASTAGRCPRARAGDVGPAARPARRHRRRGVRQAGRGGRRPGVRRGDRLPPGRGPARVARGYDDIQGALAIADELPLAPTREFAAPILGTVGEVTAEMIEDDPERYRLGDQAGLSGLQARYDDQLRGTPGVVVDAVGVRRQGARALPGRAAARASR